MSEQVETEPLIETSEDVVSTTISLNIRLMDAQTFSVNIDSKETIKTLKERISESGHELKGKWLRLIAFGRILSDNLTIEEEKLVDGSFVHCVAIAASQEFASPTRVAIPAQEMDGSSVTGSPPLPLSNIAEDNDISRHIIDISVPTLIRRNSEVPTSNAIFVSDVLVGFMIGVLLGWFAVICLVDRTVVRQGHKAGIVLGLFFTVAMAILQSMFNT